MNRLARPTFLSLAFLAAVSLAISLQAQTKKVPGGEEFFIVSSIDTAKSQVLLKRPTEVTLLMKITDKTVILDPANKPLHLTDLHAGDTVWVTSSGSDNSGPTAHRIRKGPMTVELLHRYFLDYPVIK
ncbi:MAG TPA: hypothetical protein VEX69_04785 [Candidatus Limnocylindria bacterium]|nr:hypothetical protein [Candidatus Limnocylindria bacterium]